MGLRKFRNSMDQRLALPHFDVTLQLIRLQQQVSSYLETTADPATRRLPAGLPVAVIRQFLMRLAAADEEDLLPDVTRPGLGC